MPGDFKEFFDITKLDERALGEIEFVLNSPAYRHTFYPYLKGIVNSLNTLWKDRSQERKDRYPDDFLGGGVIVAEGLLEFFEKIIQETNIERMHRAANISDEQRYDTYRSEGKVRPIVGLDQPAVPTQADPEEY